MRVVNLPRKAGDAPLLEEFEVRLDEPLPSGRPVEGGFEKIMPFEGCFNPNQSVIFALALAMQ